jgi:2-oxoglutarate ferredoxin oxidoreductase subunit gamma
MRGGTANCSVVVSETPIGSPIVSTPEVLIVMNLPSLDKFEKAVTPGGHVFVDSSLIGRSLERDDVSCVYLPATKLAEDHGLNGLANMIILGKAIAECGLCREEDISAAMRKVVPERKQALLDKNISALRLGADYH